jgi:tetratricopeptide (TPR) repeat protein
LCRRGLAQAFCDVRRLGEGIKLYELNLKLAEQKFGSDQSIAMNERHRLAHAYVAAGRAVDGIELQKSNLKLYEAKSRADSPDAIAERDCLATTYLAAGRALEAVELRKANLVVQRRQLSSNHPDTLATLFNLACLYRDLRRFDEAEPLFKQAWEGRVKALGPLNRFTIDNENHWGLCLSNMARRAEAEQHYLHSLEECRKVKDFPGDWLSAYEQRLVELYDDWGKPEKASEFLRAERALLGNDNLGLADALCWIGSARINRSKWADAEAALRESMKIRDAKVPDAWSTFHARCLLGRSLLAQNRWSEAELLLVSGYEGLMARQFQIPDSQRAFLPGAGKWIVELYERWDKPEETNRWRKRLTRSAAAVQSKS